MAGKENSQLFYFICQCQCQSQVRPSLAFRTTGISGSPASTSCCGQDRLRHSRYTPTYTHTDTYSHSHRHTHSHSHTHPLVLLLLLFLLLLHYYFFLYRDQSGGPSSRQSEFLRRRGSRVTGPWVVARSLFPLNNNRLRGESRMFCPQENHLVNEIKSSSTGPSRLRSDEPSSLVSSDEAE